MYEYLQTDTNRELSKLLHTKGLVSESGLYWHYNSDNDKHWTDTEKGKWGYPAFTFEDCIRRENAIKIWGEDVDHTFKDDVCIECGLEASRWGGSVCIEGWQRENANLFELYQSGGDWQTYIINHLKGENNV